MATNLGSCICGCGREADMPKHRLNRSCYSSIRVWSNVKTPRERAAYMNRLLVRQNRLNLIDSKEVVIGTSPYNWRKSSSSNVLRPNFRRQRGAVR